MHRKCSPFLLGLTLVLASLAQAEPVNALRPELQRPVDPRLAKITTGTLAPGDVHIVRDASEVRALSGKLKPGDQLVLAGEESRERDDLQLPRHRCRAEGRAEVAAVSRQRAELITAELYKHQKPTPSP